MSEVRRINIAKKLASSLVIVLLGLFTSGIAGSIDVAAAKSISIDPKPQLIEKYVTAAVKRVYKLEDVSVVCTNTSATQGANGYVEYTDSEVLTTIRLDTQKVCQPVAEYLGNPLDYNRDQLAYAVEIIAHEASHVAWQDSNESNTECRAVQTAGLTAQKGLGLSDQDVSQITKTIKNYEMPADYQPGAECRAGGQLDLGFDATAFRG